MARDDDDDTVDCEKHGPRRVCAIVCRHMLNSDKVVGFVENNDEPDDQQAWCDDCEALYVKEQEMTAKFRKFNDFAVVCVGCYADIKRKHSRRRSN